MEIDYLNDALIQMKKSGGGGGGSEDESENARLEEELSAKEECVHPSPSLCIVSHLSPHLALLHSFASHPPSKIVTQPSSSVLILVCSV